MSALADEVLEIGGGVRPLLSSPTTDEDWMCSKRWMRK
jgi:hypothetical protein